MPTAALLFIASATVIGVLGSIHMLYTFYGNKLHPRDAATVLAMQQSHPMLTRETTVWKATLGFNASHSLGAMLFALVFGYLAGWQWPMLQASWFLQGLGLMTLLVYWALARRYWFSIPRRGIVLTCALFAAGLAAIWWPAGV